MKKNLLQFDRLRELLNASKLNERERSDFLDRFKVAGGWTDKLAEEFAEIIYRSIATLVKDTNEIGKVFEATQVDCDRTEKEHNQALQDFETEAIDLIADHSKKTYKELEDIDSSYKKQVREIETDVVVDILQQF
jgi:hypothetical protein